MIRLKIKLSLLILNGLLFNTAIKAQSKIKRVEYSVHFDSDKYAITNQEITLFNVFLDSLTKHDVKRIYLTGHTDSDADSTYNQTLSKKRTDRVKAMLISRGIDSSIIRTSSHGEEKPIALNDEDQGKARNRRVSLRVVYELKKIAPIIEETLEKEIPVDTCKSDTSITLDQGTVLTLNKCEYLKKKDCLDFGEIFTPEAVQRENINTVDNRGNPLVSFGMFSIKKKPGCDRTCLDTTLVINIPVPDDKCINLRPRLFDLNGQNTWTRDGGSVRMVTINNRKYYQFTLTDPCTGTMKNLDCKVSEPPKVKFRVNHRYTIESIVLYDSCPFYNYTLIPDSTGSPRRIKSRLPCFVGSGFMKATVTDEEGNKITLTEDRPYQLAKRRALSKCGKIKKDPRIRNDKGLLKFRKRYMYRKYKIKRYMVRESEASA
jgi:hypothetical protein